MKYMQFYVIYLSAYKTMVILNFFIIYLPVANVIIAQILLATSIPKT